MQIKLKKLSLLNFKGVRSLDVKLNDVTNIFGDNATGKTTIFDAFLWLLFGKDSADRKDFEIKTLGPDNKPFHRMDHEVEAIINIDGSDIYLKRTFKEKWVKKRGDIEVVFSGHETCYYWNGVPFLQQEYQAKISELLNENVFKLITNTGYFNSRPWQERRNVLLQIAGEISNEEVFDSLITVTNKGQFNSLISALNSKKSIDEFKREIGAKKKKIKDDLDLIPSRIDEANRSMPDLLNYEELENILKANEQEYTNIETQLLNKTKAQKSKQEAINAKIMEIQGLRQQASEIEFAEKNKVQDNKRRREQVVIDLRRDLRNKMDDAARDAIEIANNTSRKRSLQLQQQDLRTKFTAINNEKLEFKESDTACPTCKREYEATDIEQKKKELTQNFNSHKSTRLNEITVAGKKMTEQITAIDETLAVIKTKEIVIQGEISTLQQTILKYDQENQRLSLNEALAVEQSITANKAHKLLRDKITLLEEEVNTPAATDNKQAILLEQKRQVQAKVDAVKNQLSTRKQREKIEKRIIELKDQEKSMSQELATLEGTENSIGQFMKAKMDTLERRINGRFEIVTFKLFTEQINGGQVECCDTLIKGVPYSDANNAAKIQAGLDIINTLSNHFQVTAPVFIDNRESVVTIPASQSQIINLIVSEPDKKLRVVSEKMTLAEVA